MDRNGILLIPITGFLEVALRKESVDRNADQRYYCRWCPVALRKESVDRNTSRHCMACMILTSLSARRAWIEITDSLDSILAGVVALRKESVDRNLYAVQIIVVIMCRSPQGERG